MKSLFKNSLKILGGVFAVALLVFTGMQSYALLYEVSGSELVAAFGLFVFEFGMLFWWFEFQHGAEGIAQLAISGLMFVFSMLLVMAATGLHLGAFDPQLLGRETPAKLITVAVIINVVAKMVMPLVSPDMMRSIYEKVSEGVILQKTFTQLTSKSDEIAAELSDSIANVWVSELDTRINNRYKNGNPATLPAPPAVASIATQPAMSQQEHQPAIIPLDPGRGNIGFSQPVNYTQPQAEPEPPQPAPTAQPLKLVTVDAAGIHTLENTNTERGHIAWSHHQDQGVPMYFVLGDISSGSYRITDQIGRGNPLAGERFVNELRRHGLNADGTKARPTPPQEGER